MEVEVSTGDEQVENEMKKHSSDDNEHASTCKSVRKSHFR